MSKKFIFSSPCDVHFPKVFDIEGGSKLSNAKVIYYPHHGGPNQQFIINKKKGTIKSVSSNLYVAASKNTEGASIIQLQDPKKSIRTWEFLDDDKIKLKGTNLVITLDGERNLILKPISSDLQQNWGSTKTITTKPFSEIDEARKSYLFRIVLKSNPDLCLGLIRNTTANIEPLYLVSCATDKNQPQLFYYDDASGVIGFEHSKLSLDVRGGVNSDAQIIQYPAHACANQRWKFTDDESISLREHDLCITVKGNIAEGSPIVSSPYRGTENQFWEIKPINIKKSARK